MIPILPCVFKEKKAYDPYDPYDLPPQFCEEKAYDPYDQGRFCSPVRPSTDARS